MDYVQKLLNKYQNKGIVIDTNILLLLIVGTANRKRISQFKGHITEVRLWNKARTADEIKGDMYHRLKGVEEGLAGYWPLKKVINSFTSDKTDHKNDGKVYGAVVDEQLPLLTEIGTDNYTIGVGKSSESHSPQGNPGIGGSTESGKSYRIKSSSEKLLSVQDNAASATANVIGSVNQGEEGQKWMITSDGILKSHLGGFALDMVATNDTNKQNVKIQTIDPNSLTQKWILTYDGRLINTSNNFVLVVLEYDQHYYVDAVSDSRLREFAQWNLKYEYRFQFEEI